MMTLFYIMLQLQSKKEYLLKKFMTYHAIDPWFIEKIKNIVDVEEKLKQNELDKPLLHTAKKLGFSDNQIARAKNTTQSRNS